MHVSRLGAIMARMPKYEKIRNRRLFQQSDLKQRRSSKVFAVINSGIFIWFLSAVAITLGGSIFSERQKCVADARQLIDRFDALDEELFFPRSLCLKHHP